METNILNEARLRTLRLGVEPWRVLKVMWHLKRGGSQYALYRANPPVVSQFVGHKIKTLMDAGHLNFIVERFMANRREYNQKDIYEAAENGGDHKNSRAMAFMGEDGFRLYNLEIVKEAEDAVNPGVWCVEGLEGARIPGDRVVSILSEYDVLRVRRCSAEMPNDHAVPYLLDFDGIDKYLELNYVVIFSLSYAKAPFSYIEYAADLYSKGLLWLDESLRISGENMLRYSVWRGVEYKEAYLRSLDRFHKTNASKKRLRAWVNNTVQGADTDPERRNEDEVEAEIMRHMEDHRDHK